VKKFLALSPIGYSCSIYDNYKRSDGEVEAKYRGMEEHPTWFVRAGKMCWRNKVSPFGVARLLGQRNALNLFRGYVERKWCRSHAVKPEMVGTVCDYLYQIYMRDGTTEYGPMVHFNSTVQAYFPAGDPKNWGNKEIKTPISFIYGDYDWVQIFEGDAAW